MDLRIQLAACKELQAVTKIVRGASLGTFDAHFLENKRIGVDLCGVRSHADQDNLAVLGNGIDCISGGLAGSGEVDDHVQVLVCEVGDAGLDFLGAETQSQFLCGLLSGGNVDFTALDDCDTDCELSQSADTDDTDLHAGLDAADGADRVIGGCTSVGGCCSFCNGQAFRNLDQLLDRSGCHGAVTTVTCISRCGSILRVQRADRDDITDLVTFNTLTDLDDLTADLMSHDNRNIETRHPALQIQSADVRVAQAAGQSLQHDITRFRFRIRLLDDLQRLMCSGKFPTFHDAYPP